MSEAQTAANRANAQLSTGPATAEGKAIAARNSTRHGLTARETLLPEEDAGALAALEEGIHASLAPVGELEHALVDRIVHSVWRLRRCAAVELALFAVEGANAIPGSDHALLPLFTHYTASPPPLERLVRYENHIERAMFRALGTLRELQAARVGEADADAA